MQTEKEEKKYKFLLYLEFFLSLLLIILSFFYQPHSFLLPIGVTLLFLVGLRFIHFKKHQKNNNDMYRFFAEQKDERMEFIHQKAPYTALRISLCCIIFAGFITFVLDKEIISITLFSVGIFEYIIIMITEAYYDKSLK